MRMPYWLVKTGAAGTRPAYPERAMRKIMIGLIACLATATAARANDLSLRLPFFGVAPWGDWARDQSRQWDGAYLRMNSGFSAMSVRKGPSIAGPTIGLETGKFWREGRWVYGVAADTDYMPVSVGRFAGTSGIPLLTRDFAGHADIKSGYLVRPDLLVYGSVGVTGVNYTLRGRGVAGGKDSAFILRPDMRAGAVWAVNENTSITLEVGVRPALR